MGSKIITLVMTKGKKYLQEFIAMQIKFLTSKTNIVSGLITAFKKDPVRGLLNIVKHMKK